MRTICHSSLRNAPEAFCFAPSRFLMPVAQFPDLSHVMASVYPMKFSPLAARQGTENWMIENTSSPAEAGLAFRNCVVHGNNCWNDCLDDLLRRHAARNRDRRSLSARGHIPETDDDCRSHSVWQRRSAVQGFPLLQAPLTAFHGAAVSEVKVFQHFGGTPFSLGMRCELFCAHAGGGGSNGGLQLLQITIQALVPRGTRWRIGKDAQSLL